MSSPPSLTLTSLLNSLHTHLQSQTQLLPTLHLQLGLPPTALADELKAIEAQLIQSVESQINARRKEVGLWIEKCETCENECILYTKALGGNARSAGINVGELVKERILPKRYEMASAHQEKLRQIYHTKLEQLMALTTRLKNLSRTLGRDFYSADILTPMPSNGAPEHSSSHLDVTPERFSKLEKELVRGKTEVGKRLSQLSTAFLQIDWLYAELGMAPPSPDMLPQPHHRSASSSSSSSNDPFLSSSITTPTLASRNGPAKLLFVTPEDVAEPGPSDLECERIFAAFVSRIEAVDEAALVEGSTFGLEGVDPSPSLLRWAERTRIELEDVKRRREAHIQAMYDQLEALWRRLGVSEADMDGFVDAHKGSTEVTVSAYEEELERMLELKRERMGTFIANAREEIFNLWDELMIGDEEKSDFAPFADEEHTEELLSIHEEEIARLKGERKLKGSLLSSIKKYFEICDEEKELAAAASDQTRLLGRGVRGDPGRLLREEKMRKRVHKEKPRLEQDLLTSIPAWEAETGQPFLVHGESILKMLMETVSASEKENAGNKRKNSSKRSASQHAPAVQYAPSGSGKGSVRPSSSLGASSAKRARLGDSADSSSKPPSSGPQPLAPRRGQTNVSRPASPTKDKKPPSSLPRPVSSLAHLRAGKVGAVAALSFGSGATHLPAVTLTTTSRYCGPVDVAAVTRKATRARRESFRPRPSVDATAASTWQQGSNGRWSSKVKEQRVY